jgi:hypothetical protein
MIVLSSGSDSGSCSGSAKYFFVLGALLLFKMRKKITKGIKVFAGKAFLQWQQTYVSNKNFKILLLVKIFLTY